MPRKLHKVSRPTKTMDVGLVMDATGSIAEAIASVWPKWNVPVTSPELVSVSEKVTLMGDPPSREEREFDVASPEQLHVRNGIDRRRCLVHFS
jgi:hypothetical protein